MKKLIPVLLIIVLLASCRATRSIHKALNTKPAADTTIVVAHPDSVKTIDSAAVIREQYAGLQKNRISYNSFSAKIDVDFVDGEGKKTNVTAHLRMMPDSIIWISITGMLNMEGMRALIRLDSVFILDKLHKKYYPRSVSYLQEMTDLPLSLHTLQELLIGNPVYMDTAISGYEKNGNTVSLISVGAFFKNFVTIADDNKRMSSCKLDDVDMERNRTCFLSYDSYEDKTGQVFATEREISVSEKKKLDFHLQFRQYSFNETLTFPFSVPKNYKEN